MLGVVQIQLNSPFGYDEEFASRFAYTTSRCKASGYPFTSPAAYALSSSAATSSTYITTPECSDPYQVQANDTCDSIALAQNVSTDGLQVAGGLSQTCSNLHAVGPFCLPPSCALYYVQVDDTCESILSANPGLTASQLLAWNPGINSMCGNIRYFEYTYICIGWIAKSGGHASTITYLTSTDNIGHRNPSPKTNKWLSPVEVAMRGMVCRQAR
ncbi:uncharacterized protein LDX57_005688 [Aspergillus melleus]|uniref:uncharacterized protein n=1 Tax=Aspergillus melleus TaxID=138277 RepID=UPI001E8D11AC|nr:uncharacterized protein LDX57_005688 [Aspergillus melleus]KAH8427982.1 hypothetical protein LDX57_005688 [Aspergillus melleus]